jgi:hypothetical protein
VKPPKNKTGGPRPPVFQSSALQARYACGVRCRTGCCIMTAAMLRHTAAAAANVKSEIHMARFPRSVSVRLMVLDCGVNAGRGLPVPGTLTIF